jgi:hypothetical protein
MSRLVDFDWSHARRSLGIEEWHTDRRAQGRCGQWALEEPPMPRSGRFDPDLLRSRVLDALHEMPGRAELDALHAIDRGEIDIEERPVDDELLVRIGELTVVVARSACVTPVEE